MPTQVYNNERIYSYAACDYLHQILDLMGIVVVAPPYHGTEKNRLDYLIGVLLDNWGSTAGPYWTTAGNDTGTTTKILGTTTNADIHITTNNATIGTWFSTGQWGIGLTDADTPAAKLHVDSGAALTSSIMRIENNTAFSDFFVSNATPEGAINGTRGSICYVDTGVAGQVYIKATGTGNTGWSQLTTGGGGATTFSALTDAYDLTTSAAFTIPMLNSGSTALFPANPFDNIPLAVNAATTSALPAVTYNNGAGGVGATLTADANGAFPTTDGVAATINNRYLVKNQASNLQNGVYQLTTVGDGSNPFVLTRTTDSDATAEFDAQVVIPSGGSANKGRIFRQQFVSPTVGTNPIVYVATGLGGGGGSTALSALTAGVVTNSIDSANYAQVWAWSTLTTETAISLTGNAVSTGSLLALSSTSTAGDASKLLQLTRSGANAGSAKTNYGLYASITNTGTTSTNIAGYFEASGGATANYGLVVGAGSIAGSTSSGGNMTLTSTTHATKGKIYWGSAATSYFDENAGVARIVANGTGNPVILTMYNSTASSRVLASFGDSGGTLKYSIGYSNSGAGYKATSLSIIDVTSLGVIVLDSGGRVSMGQTYTSSTTNDTSYVLTVDNEIASGAGTPLGIVMRRNTNTVNNGIPLTWKLYNGSSAFVTYADINGSIITNTAGAHYGALSLSVTNNAATWASLSIVAATSNTTNYWFGNGEGGTASAGPINFGATSVRTGLSNDVPGETWTFKGSRGVGTGVGGSIIFQVAPAAAGSASTPLNALVNIVEILGSGKGVAFYQQATPITPSAVTDGFVIYSNDAAGAGTACMMIKNENSSNIKLFQNTGWTIPTGTATKGGWDTSTATLANVAETVKAMLDHLLTNMEIFHS